MANGNGTCAALWKTSCDLKQVAPKVPSCTACKKRLLMGSVDPFEGCPDKRCANWNIDGTTNLLSFSLANFPFAEKCLPLRLSNQMLMFAIEKTHAFVASEVWSLKSAGSFLSRHVISSENIETCLSRAKNAQSLAVEKRLGDNAPTGTLWRDRKAEHPHDFVPWKGPES